MSTQTKTDAWTPSKTELESILAEMRPVIARFCERDRRLLASWSEAA